MRRQTSPVETRQRPSPETYCRLNRIVNAAWKLPPGGGGAWTAAIIACTSPSIAALPEDQ